MASLLCVTFGLSADGVARLRDKFLSNLWHCWYKSTSPSLPSTVNNGVNNHDSYWVKLSFHVCNVIMINYHAAGDVAPDRIPRKKPFNINMSRHGDTLRITGPLWGESTGHRWIPLAKGQWCGPMMFSLLFAQQAVQQTCELLMIWDATFGDTDDTAVAGNVAQGRIPGTENTLISWRMTCGDCVLNTPCSK